MKKRPLGQTGMDVSEVAFGGVGIGMPYAGQAMPDRGESIKLLHAALDSGINYFDTARLYGISEELMGEAFRHRREEVILNTKCIHFLDSSGRIPDDLDVKKTILDSFDKSLKVLRTDYIDVFMLHQSSPDIFRNEEVARVFSDLKQSGKVKAIGASTYTLQESKMAIEKSIWDVLQVPFNLMDQQQAALFPLAYQNGVGLIIRSVLFRGYLTDRTLDLPGELDAVEQHLRRINILTEDPAMQAMKFVLSYPEVSSVLIGMDQMNHLTKALEVADGKYYDSEFRAQLEALAFPDPAFLNFSQWVKNGWLKN